MHDRLTGVTGPFALIEGPSGANGATPIIMIILDDEDGPDMLTAAHQVGTSHSTVRTDVFQ